VSHVPDNDASDSDSRGWLSIAWGLAVVAAFVAIQGVQHYIGKNGTPVTTEPQSDEFQQAILDKGISVKLVIHSRSEEYAKGRNGDLNLTKQAADIESVITIGRQGKTMRSLSDNQLPNPDAGEVDRCRLVFGDDGRVFLNTHERVTVGGTEVLEVMASYELEFVEGSRADYEAGGPIQLAYTAESLEKRREALRSSLAVQWMPILQREVPYATTMTFDMKCVVDPLPQSSMIAAPSSLLVEDSGPVKAVITVAVSKR
jgi:hypothetical protein